MRDYAKLAPRFWHSAVCKELRRRGSEGVVVALYLISAPTSNMLGVYELPVLYMAHETGLGIEGASKGLRDCIECGFCSYDNDTEIVFVHEMAKWQIADSLSQGDKRCKGIQKDFKALPECPFLDAFYDRYAEPFHLTARHPKSKVETQAPYQAPSKPHRSQEQEQEQEQEPFQGSAAKAPRPSRKCPEGFEVTDDLAQWARENTPGVSVPKETAKFRDYTFGTARSDWPGTWRNWMRKAFEIRGGKAPSTTADELFEGAH